MFSIEVFFFFLSFSRFSLAHVMTVGVLAAEPGSDLSTTSHACM